MPGISCPEFLARNFLPGNNTESVCRLHANRLSFPNFHQLQPEFHKRFWFERLHAGKEGEGEGKEGESKREREREREQKEKEKKR